MEKWVYPERNCYSRGTTTPKHRPVRERRLPLVLAWSNTCSTWTIMTRATRNSQDAALHHPYHSCSSPRSHSPRRLPSVEEHASCRNAPWFTAVHTSPRARPLGSSHHGRDCQGVSVHAAEEHACVACTFPSRLVVWSMRACVSCWH